jgi:hypothetical protein
MRELKELPTRRDVWFILGIHPFLGQHPALVERCRLWLHLGANIGAAIDYQPRVSAPDEATMIALQAAFQEAGVPEVEFLPIGSVAGGESQIVAPAGRALHRHRRRLWLISYG